MALLLLGCRRDDKKSAREPEAPPANGPIARVNGVAVPREPFEREYARMIGRSGQSFQETKSPTHERMKNLLVARMVEAEVIRQKARALGLVVSPEEEAEEWQAYKKRYGSEEAFRAAAGRLGTTVDELRPRLAEDFLRRRVLEKAAEGVSVTPEEGKAYYEANQARFVDPEEIRLSEISIRVPHHASAEERAEKKKRAEAVLKKAKGKGADFAKLAGEYDESPAKDRGGDLGFAARNRVGSPLVEVVWPLEVGEIRLVETPAGYVIAKKTEEKPAHQKSFAETKDQIERMLLSQKRQEATRGALAAWKNEAKIEILENDQSHVPGVR